jgi:hypothetical protein
MAKPKAAGQVYQLKVTLRYIKPPVWRRVQVKDCSLARIHHIIQAYMGWEDYHLHEFLIGGERYGDPFQWQDDFGGESEVGDEGKVKLGRLAARGVKKFTYVYDMGDTWEQRSRSRRCCPPSRASTTRGASRASGPAPGGLRRAVGAGDFVEAVRNPGHERHEELLEWVGGEFDPEAFDIAAANEALRCAGREGEGGRRDRERVAGLH